MNNAICTRKGDAGDYDGLELLLLLASLFGGVRSTAMSLLYMSDTPGWRTLGWMSSEVQSSPVMRLVPHPDSRFRCA